jgi:hypothetical protein
MSESLVLKSVPETYIRPNVPPMPEPYARIIGAGLAAAEVHYDDKLIPAHSQQITTHELTVSRGFSERFLSFWLQKEWANCFSFAAHMAGKLAVNLEQSLAVSDYMFNHGEPADATEPLTMGVIGILGNPVSGGEIEDCQGEGGTYISVHASVGIGNERPETLQVMSNSDFAGGIYLGLVSPEQELEYLRKVLAGQFRWSNDNLQARVYTPDYVAADF